MTSIAMILKYNDLKTIMQPNSLKNSFIPSRGIIAWNIYKYKGDFYADKKLLIERKV